MTSTKPLKTITVTAENGTDYWVVLSASGSELFNLFTGPVELVDLYRKVVRNYTELKLAGDFDTAAAVAEDARMVSDRLILRWGADESWISERKAEAEAEALEVK